MPQARCWVFHGIVAVDVGIDMGGVDMVVDVDGVDMVVDVVVDMAASMWWLT